jgi:catechol 2,3-dioxygenase-like lactoylglutathione lyase family enzyme
VRSHPGRGTDASDPAAEAGVASAAKRIETVRIERITEMLKQMHAVLPAADLARARKYYHDVLGMDPAEEHEQGTLLTYYVDGSAFDVYQTENAGTAKNTQLCFGTDDLDAEMRMMRERGVMFEEFEIPDVMKTENGIVTDDEGSRTAWFRDSESNFLCITQRSDAAMNAGSNMMGDQMGGAM